MAEIEEIPLEPQESTENAQEKQPTIEEHPEETLEDKLAPKKRGRPVGAKNKPKPPAAKAKAKPKAKAAPQYESDSEEDEAPPPALAGAKAPRPRGRVAQPQELDRHALASEVLNILQQQRYDRTNARRSHYAAWFANM